jgi:16S rRNA (cytosine967-C5)-methyltransferase
VLGVVRWRRALECLLQQLARTQPRAEVESCIYVGLYQLYYLDDVQEYAAVHETVEAAKHEAGAKAGGFVNALLRRAQREKETLRAKLARQPAAVRWSHPDLLFERWQKNLGAENAARLCEWNNTRSETRMRVRPGREFQTVPRGQRVGDIEGFAEGAYVVQDPATMIAVDLLDVHPGQRVLDACAAPGGKTIALCDALQGGGELVAMDVHEDRLAVLRENLARAKCNDVRVEKGDAAHVEIPGTFDRILLDVPCSNTGVIRRRPDARWRFSVARLTALTSMQRALLDNASRALKPGGKIVYSTCSMEPEENEQLVDAWLKGHPEFVRVSERKSFPPDSGIDGAYAAALARK